VQIPATQINPIASIPPPYAHVREEQLLGVSGGDFTSGTWVTRGLNAITSDDGSICSLASSQVQLLAGTYICHFIAMCWVVGQSQARLQNVTSGTTLILGASCYEATTHGELQMVSYGSGQFVVGGQQKLELQHRCSDTKAADGRGVPDSFATEIYSQIEFWKVV